MKKVTLWSFIITAFMFVVNLLLSLYLKVNLGSSPPLSHANGVAFGVKFEPYINIPDGAVHVDKVSFDPFSLVFTFVFIFMFATLVHFTVRGFKEMKKGTIISLIITVGLFVINYLCALIFDFTFGIPFRLSDSKYIINYLGFGVFHSSDKWESSTYPEFVSLVLTYALVLGIAALICRCKKSRKAENNEK